MKINVRAYERSKNINKLICGLKSIKLQQWKLIMINHAAGEIDDV